MEWFSTDWHLGHPNILKYDSRPFKNIGHMNQTILDNTCALLKPGDDFYYLGDFCLGSLQTARSALFRLYDTGANLFFIKGNHDKKDMIKLYKEYGTFLGGLESITIGDQVIVLCHYKMAVWDRSHRGAWHLYGHSHGHAEKMPIGKSFDVAINIWDYKPLSYDQVSKIMAKREKQKIDHHG